MTSIRFLDPTEPLFPHEIRVILRTMGHVEHGIAVRDDQFICDIFLFASHFFGVDFTRISLALDMRSDEEKYAVSGGYQILTGYERITQIMEPLEKAGHILEILIKDGDILSPYPSPIE
jgi:hypothetical protein